MVCIYTNKSVFNFYNIFINIRKNNSFFNSHLNRSNFIFIFLKFQKSNKLFFQQLNYLGKSKELQTKIHVIRFYLKGIGYKFLRPKKSAIFLRIELGYSISIYMFIPKSIKVFTKKDKIIILSSNYRSITDFSKRIFQLRPADDYKGKGVRYTNIKYSVFKPGKQRLLD